MSNRSLRTQQRAGTGAGRCEVMEHGWCEGTCVSAAPLSILVALSSARRSPDLTHSDFPSLGSEVPEGAGWMCGCRGRFGQGQTRCPQQSKGDGSIPCGCQQSTSGLFPGSQRASLLY